MVQPLNPGGDPIIFVPDTINLPDISKNAFSSTKGFFGMTYQQNKPWFDFDINSFSDETAYTVLMGMNGFLTGIASPSSGATVIDRNGNIGFTIEEASSTTNNFDITAGFAYIAGRTLRAENDFSYTDANTNYVVYGQVTGITEVISGSVYIVQDSEKLFNAGYQVDKCRIKFLSGDEAGNIFSIHSLQGYDLRVLGDLSNVTSEDTYVILPPALSTPTSNGTEDDVYLVCWWEDISPMENRVLENPTTLDAYNVVVNAGLDDPLWASEHPSHRTQLRWCIYVNYDETSYSTNPYSTGIDVSHMWIKLGTITRNSGVSAVTTATITNSAEKMYSLMRVYDTLDAMITSITTGTLNATTLNVSGTSTLYNLITQNVSVFQGITSFSATTTFNNTVVFNDDITLQAMDFINDLKLQDDLYVDVIREYTTSAGVSIKDTLKVDTISADLASEIAASDTIDCAAQVWVDTLASHTTPLSGAVSTVAGFNVGTDLSVAGDTDVVGTLTVDTIEDSGAGDVTVNTKLVVDGGDNNPDIVANNVYEYKGSVQYIGGTTFAWAGTPVGFDSSVAPTWDAGTETVSLTLSRPVTDNSAPLKLCANITPFSATHTPYVAVWSADTPVTKIIIKFYVRDNIDTNGYLTHFSITVTDLG